MQWDRIRWRISGLNSEFDASEIGFTQETFHGEEWNAGGEIIATVHQKKERFIDVVAGIYRRNIMVENTTLAERGKDDFLLPRVGIDLEQREETFSIFGSVDLEWNCAGAANTDDVEINKLGRLDTENDWTVFHWRLLISFYLDPWLMGDKWESPSEEDHPNLTHELVLNFSGQYSPDRLIPQAMFPVGGMYTVRGYPETVATGATYTRVLYAGMVTILLLFLNNAIYRGAGDAATAMRALWLANAINLILDPCLIFGLGPFPEMGLVGAAVATTIGRGTGVVYQLWGLSRGKRLRVTRSDVRINLRVIARLLRLAAGGVGQMLIVTTSYVGLIRILATFGSTVLAGYVISIRLVLFIILPAWGLSNAAATLVGQNLGAHKPERAERAVWLTGTWNMVFMALVTVVFVSFAPQIIHIFTHDPGISAIGIESLRIISYGYVFYAWGMVMMQAFNGAGDTVTPTWINLFCFWLFQIPMAWILAIVLDMGPTGVFLAIASSYSLEAVVGVILFRRGRWKEKKV